MTEILASVYRGPLAESVHRGDWVVCDAAGSIVYRQGNPEKVTYWRSSAKPFQALPVVEDGVMEDFGITSPELAVICASHSGEADHVEAVAGILAKIGLDSSYLQCGVHPPVYRPAAEALAAQGLKPSEIHSNCSGKHSGMLALCVHHQWDLRTYLEPAHPLQQLTKTVVADVTQTQPDAIVIGVDGCGVPVFGISLAGMARAWALLAEPRCASGSSRCRALTVVGDAMRAHPHLVAGTERFDTDLMVGFGRRSVLAKMGAEAVYCVGLPEQGWGLALKVEDGSSRAVPAIVLAILDQLGYTAANIPELEQYNPLLVKNHRQDIIGKITAEVTL